MAAYRCGTRGGLRDDPHLFPGDLSSRGLTYKDVDQAWDATIQPDISPMAEAFMHYLQ